MLLPHFDGAQVCSNLSCIDHLLVLQEQLITTQIDDSGKGMWEGGKEEKCGRQFKFQTR